MNNSLIQIFMC